MLGGLVSFFGGLFSSSKLQDTAIDGIRKLGNLDEMSGKDKATFLLDYMKATAHQSPTRRFIAVLLSVLYTVFCVVWLIGACLGYGLDYAGAILFVTELKGFLVEILFTPFNLILSFYFVLNIASKLGK